MRCYLGIDGGGTFTRAVLISAAGAVLGRGQSGASNFNNVGNEIAGRHLQEATLRAVQDAGRKNLDVQGAFLGLAAIKSADDMARMAAVAESFGIAPVGTVIVRNDIYNAHAGGLSGAAGIAVIAGTGSHCLGRDVSGADYLCGGWGWFLDDQGSAFGLAAAALREVVRAADGRSRQTRLQPAALAFLGVQDAACLLARLHDGQWNPGVLAGFAPVVTRLALEGDRTAERVLRRGAEALAELVAVTANNLKFPHGPDVVLLGSCARSGMPYESMLEKQVAKKCPLARIVPPAYDTLYGAAVNALMLAHPDTPMSELPQITKF